MPGGGFNPKLTGGSSGNSGGRVVATNVTSHMSSQFLLLKFDYVNLLLLDGDGLQYLCVSALLDQEQLLLLSLRLRGP